MTEIERIIKKGVISEEFLKEEVRNDFVVTTERKKLWAVMLDILFEYDSVCKKYGLTYYLWSGSLLGAVRHSGFIPWDDDIDVIMPRDDYEKFLQLGSEFKDPYFFQTPYTDPGYYYSFAKIRNSNTTGVVDMFAYNHFNHGIWISILPLDNWDIEGGLERFETIKQLLIDCSTAMRVDNPNLSESNKERVRLFKQKGVEPITLYEKIFNITRHQKDKPSQFVAHDSCTLSTYEKQVFASVDFLYPIYVEVEGFSMPIPNGYKNILKTMYGDYMKFPPIEYRGLWHSGTTFIPDLPYKQYLEQLYTDNNNH